MAKIILAGLILVLGQTGGESLADSIGWLQTYLGGAACAVFEMGASGADLKQVTEGTEVLFNNCDMTLETSTIIGGTGDLQSFHISLGQLNPASVALTDGIKVPTGWITFGEVPTRTLRLATKGGAKLIDVKVEQYGENAPAPQQFKASEINIHIRNKDTADQVAKAMTQAITLCGAKNQ